MTNSLNGRQISLITLLLVLPGLFPISGEGQNPVGQPFLIWLKPGHPGDIQLPAPELAEKILHAGFNGVVTPGFFEGQTHYPSKLHPRGHITPGMLGDLDSCRSAHLKVAVYIQALIHGGDLDHPTHLASRHPEWLSSHASGKPLAPSTLLGGGASLDGVFLDPGDPRVKDFLLALLVESVGFYKPDWVILDQVRYPLPDPPPQEGFRNDQPYGYHPAARSSFENEFGADPVSFMRDPIKSADSLGPERLASLQIAWDDWRRMQVNDFIESARRLLAKEHPSCNLAVVGYPDPYLARRVMMQDWPSWIREGIVDAVILPFNDLNNASARFDLLPTGLREKIWGSCTVTLSGEESLIQAEKIRALAKLPGLVLFDASHLADEDVANTVAGALRNEEREGPLAPAVPIPSTAKLTQPQVGMGQTLKDVHGLYGFQPGTPPFEGLTPNQITEQLTELGFNAVFSRTLEEEMRRALEVAGIHHFAEFPFFVGSEHWERDTEAQPVARNGRKILKHNWYSPVCPNVQWLRDEKLEAMVSMVREQRPDGVWLDFIRYPVYWEEVPPSFMPDTCFCENCLRQFQSAAGLLLEGKSTADKAEWILGNHPETWYRWRADTILAYIEELAAAVHQVSPKTLVGAFVLPWRKEDHGNAIYRVAGQDISGFGERLDVLSPMLYFHELRQPASWVRDRIVEMDAEVPCPILPIIQCFDEPDPIPETDLNTALMIALQSPSKGAILFSQRHLEKTGRWQLLTH